jgi:hypothetical protein
MLGRLGKRRLLSDTVTGNVFSGDRSKKIPRVDASSHPTSRKEREKWGTQFFVHPHFSGLLADAELSNDSFIALGIVSFEVVQ